MIRKAEIKDIPAIIKLLLQVQNVHAEGRPDIFIRGGQKYTESELLPIIKDNERHIFVYETDDGDVVGYCFCVYQINPGNTSQKPRKTLYIDDLCVDGNARKKGVGRSLYEYTLAFAAAEGFDSVTLNVWECNPGALKFYQNMGLIPLKTTMEKIL